jgi:hypothetical protein
MTIDDVVPWLAEAQTRNALLEGDELAAAAAATADIARHRHAALIAEDGAGERIIGATIALNPGECTPADLTQRFDGQTLLLVCGVIAGSVGLAQTAARLRSLGAQAVHVCILGGWTEPIPGIETITTLGTARPHSPSSATAA